MILKFYPFLLDIIHSVNDTSCAMELLCTGPWRWFDESMLDCCEPLEKVKAKGISFGKVVCLAHCAGAKVSAFRTHQSSLDDFRKYVMACSASDDCHVISSYHRGTFEQVTIMLRLLWLPL